MNDCYRLTPRKEKLKLLTLLTLFTSLVFTPPLYANIKLEGCLVAKQTCEALHSIRKQTNPGNVKLEPYQLYSVTGINKNKATHYQIVIPQQGKNDSKRWVRVSCGNYVSNCRLIASSSTNETPLNITTNQTIPTTKNNSKYKNYLLALSWEPTFCETHQQKTECKTLTSTRQDANYLSLHGLWPQPRNNAYCNVGITTKTIDRRKKWGLLEKLELSDETRKKLAIVMPGYASNLQRHEWVKHGTCYGKSAELYYQDAIRLTDTINQSEVGILLKNNIGKRVSSTEVRQAFNQAFGEGLGKKVNMRCDKKGRLGELWINLSGDISSDSSLSSLLKNAVNASNNCESGLVDPV